MADDGFSLPGGGYDEVVRIIRAYLSAGDDATVGDVADRAAMNTTQVSRNNRFLFDVGVLEKRPKNLRALTPTGRELAAALEHDQADEIQRSWRELVQASGFLDKIVAAVRIRSGMDPDALHSHIAYSSGRPKSAQTMTGARTTAHILIESGLLQTDDDGTVRAMRTKSTESPTERMVPPPRPLEVNTPRLRPTVESPWWWADYVMPSPEGQAPSAGVSLQIQIQCSVEDLEDLGPRLRKLLDELATHDHESAAAESNDPASD